MGIRWDLAMLGREDLDHEAVIRRAVNHIDELKESLAYVVANIGQPRSLETREGFAKAEELLRNAHRE
jgi:hypothetical protein